MSPNGINDTEDRTSKDDTGYVVSLDPNNENDTAVNDVSGDFGYQPIVTNPISLASFESKAVGDEVQFTWTTQTEVANLGFHIYAQVDGSWVKLNDSLIKGRGDSVSLREYSASYPTNATYFAISDVDIYGKETLHGPFKLGELSDGVSEAKKTVRSKVQSDAVIDLEERRKQMKQYQMQQRNRLRSRY